MARQLSNESSLDNLKREAKRWLRALRENDAAARARLLRAVPTPNDQPTLREPTLRDVQHALAREHGMAGWTELATAVEVIKSQRAAPGDNDDTDPELREFLQAAAQGDVTTIKARLDSRPAMIDTRGTLPGHTGQRTALHFAVGSPKSVETVGLLLERGANPNIRDEGDNAFPLHFAAERRDLTVVRMLLDNAADTDGEGDYHELGVMGWATVFGDDSLDVAIELLRRGAVHTLPSAVVMGDVAAILALVEQHPEQLGMRLDAANRRRSLLHLAVIKRQSASLDTLLKLGCDVNATDVSGLTALEQAVMDDNVPFADTLIAAGAEIGLLSSIVLGRTNELERLLRAEPDALRKGQRHGQLIVQASERAPAHVITTLLKLGADANARAHEESAVDSTTGYTALHAASFHGNLPVVDALIDAGADVRAREERFCSTPAGWARHGNHPDVAARILREDIDLFDAAEFNLPDRIREIVARDPGSLRRSLGAYVRCVPTDGKPWKIPSKLPIDAARSWGNVEAERVLQELMENSATRHREMVSRFLRLASPDRRLVSGSEIRIARNTASRLLEQHPELAGENIYSAVVCGDAVRVRELLGANPALASAPDDDRQWPPLLFLSNAQLRQPACSEHAVEIAQLLLDHGADPNVYTPGGAEVIGYDEGDIHFTVLTNVIGRGEGRMPPHPRMRDLVPLLLEYGANPYDKQVLYNVFADHSSRADLNDDIIWLMDLLYEHSVRAGHEADWKDPLWRMLDVGSYGPGSNFLMMAAVATNSLGLTEWLLQHGAGPDVRSDHPRYAQFRALEYAVRSGNAAMQALLSRYGAKSASNLQLSPYEAFARACMNGDREFARTEIAKHPEWTRIPHALMIAAREDNADAVRLLLELGVSPDIEEGRRARALHSAAFRGSVNAAKVLLDAGADPDARETGYNSTPMGVASFAQQTAMTDLLADYSRDVFNLVFAGKVQRVREVLAEDASLAKGRTPNGESMLMRLPDDEDIAVQLVELLLANGADPTLTDRNGLTAAALAERRALTRVVDLLRG